MYRDAELPLTRNAAHPLKPGFWGGQVTLFQPINLVD